jgi:hypothetical protein
MAAFPGAACKAAISRDAGAAQERCLFRRLQSGRRQPLMKMGGGFGLPRSANELVTLDARRRSFGFQAQPRCLFFKALIQRGRLLEALSLHAALQFRGQ